MGRTDIKIMICKRKAEDWSTVYLVTMSQLLTLPECCNSRTCCNIDAEAGLPYIAHNHWAEKKTMEGT